MNNIILAATHRNPCDLVLKNAKYLNVFTNEWLSGDIGVVGDMIVGVGDYDGVDIIDCQGKHVVPGFIDSHVHIESSLATPSIFVGEIVRRGTTTIIADPHEIANVSGMDGLKYIFDSAELSPITTYITVPSCVPATPYETSGATLLAQDIVQYLDHPNCLGLGEMMNTSFVYNCDASVIDKLQAFKHKHLDGHIPRLQGGYLNAYRACGISTDHETSYGDDMLNKVRLGFTILARQGSSCHNLQTLLRTAMQHNIPYSNFAFCSDDKHIWDINSIGHIDYCIRLAIECGIPTIECYKMASYYSALAFGIKNLGAIAPSYIANLAIIDDIDTAKVSSVIAKGKLLVDKGSLIQPVQHIPAPDSICHSVHAPTITSDILHLNITRSPVPIINVQQGELLTKKSWQSLPLGIYQHAEELNKVAVITRHANACQHAVGLVGQYNIQGAIASTVSHDSHNIVVIGSNDDDMALACNTLCELDGGYVVTHNGVVTASVALPIAGLMSDANPQQLQDDIRHLISTAHSQGVANTLDPLQPLSFLALAVLPEIRITDKGVILFDGFEFVEY